MDVGGEEASVGIAEDSVGAKSEGEASVGGGVGGEAALRRDDGARDASVGRELSGSSLARWGG